MSFSKFAATAGAKSPPKVKRNQSWCRFSFLDAQKEVPKHLRWKYGEEVLPEVKVLTTNRYFKSYNGSLYENLYDRAQLQDQEEKYKNLKLKPKSDHHQAQTEVPSLECTFQRMLDQNISTSIRNQAYDAQFYNFLIQSKLNAFDRKEFNFTKNQIIFKDKLAKLQDLNKKTTDKYLTDLDKIKEIKKYESSFQQQSELVKREISQDKNKIMSLQKLISQDLMLKKGKQSQPYQRCQQLKSMILRHADTLHVPQTCFPQTAAAQENKNKASIFKPPDKPNHHAHKYYHALSLHKKQQVSQPQLSSPSEPTTIAEHPASKMDAQAAKRQKALEIEARVLQKMRTQNQQIVKQILVQTEQQKFEYD